MIRLAVGIVLALYVTLAVAVDTGILRLTTRDYDGLLPSAAVTLLCPNTPPRTWLTGKDGSVVIHDVPATSRDESGCTLVVTMPSFVEAHVAGITIQPGRERGISLFMITEYRGSGRIFYDDGAEITCPSLDDLLRVLFEAKASDVCEHSHFDPWVLPVLERRKPIYGGKVVSVRRVRAPNGRALWVLEFWEDALVVRKPAFYRAYYASTRVPVQSGPERDTETLSFFERGETVLVRTDSRPIETDRVPVVTRDGYWGWVDADKLTDGWTETLQERP